MPRGPRLDFPGALHHVIARGIERRRIFLSDRDRRLFLDRLGSLVGEADAGLYAWALMPNHAHALLRTGAVGLSRFMQRWLGPYAVSFNLRHRRAGHLFQNRFKNVLVEEERYLLELIRYIHLNPVRSRLPVTIDWLAGYAWTGHASLLGVHNFAAQDTDFVLRQFGATVGEARRAYADFIREGAAQKEIPDLEGGGLRRSAGGWELIPRLSSGRERWASDERILGSSEFVSSILGRASNLSPLIAPHRCERLLEALCANVGALVSVSPQEIASSSLRRPVLEARAMVSHAAVRQHGLSPAVVARHLHVSHQSIGRALDRAEAAFARHGCSPGSLASE